jgi:hypothetical protein
VAIQASISDSSQALVGGDLAAAGEAAGALEHPDGVAGKGGAVGDLVDVEETVAAAAQLGQEVGEDVLDGDPGGEEGGAGLRRRGRFVGFKRWHRWVP